jgi:2-amino-4-hydroxy-6-hydroxymethyldihydropteridine diphosphokinase
LGPKEQPDYVNAVAKLETGLAPLALLRQLQDIEQNHGRVRKAERWGARTLDLDIILFGQLKVLSEELTIPHYHFHHREFVLYPLSELEPELVITDMSDVPSLLKKVPLNGLTVIRSAKDLKIPE